MKLLFNISAFFIISFQAGALCADSLDDIFKGDFSRQETIKIRYEVNRRLYSYEAGKFKIDNNQRNRDKIRAITDKIAAWAIMERMTPPEVARIIVYAYHADEAGAAFADTEDLIPLVSRHDIPLKDFMLIVQYNKETRDAGVPDVIREAFLGYTFSNGWDGVSILAGGRGLILAKASRLNINKTASLLVKKLPAKGSAVKTGTLSAIIENIIGESAKEKKSREIMDNLENTHKSFSQAENSAGLKEIQSRSSQSAAAVESVNRIKIPEKTISNNLIDKESGIITEEVRRAPKENWQALSKKALYETIRPWLGTPYRYGCKTGRPGIDCSGFTRNVLTDGKIGVPPGMLDHSAAGQSNAGSPVAKRELRAGDLVFFSASPDRKKITHVGLATSPGYFTHASLHGVVNDELGKKWWVQRYVLGRRLFIQVKE